MKNVRKELAIFSLIIGVIGCGQNNHVTADLEKSAKVEGVSTLPQGSITTIEGPTGASGSNGLSGKDGASGKDGLNGKDGVNGKDGKDGKTEIITKIITEPAPTPAPVNPPVIVNPPNTTPTIIVVGNGNGGKDGSSGKDGKNGRDGESSCIKPGQVIEEASSFSMKQLKEMKENGISKKLPYYLSAGKNDPTLELLSLNQNSKGKKFVHDSEIIFQTNFTIPNIQFIEKKLPVTAKLTMKLAKKKEDKGKLFNDTEIFCSFDKKVCSGSWFHDSDFKKLINKSYVMVNDAFSEELKLGIEEALSLPTNDLEFTTSRDFDLAVMFSNKPMTTEELLEYIYDSVKKDVNSKTVSPKLKFVVADDTKIVEAKLTVNYFYNGCALEK